MEADDVRTTVCEGPFSISLFSLLLLMLWRSGDEVKQVYLDESRD
jgi:hypothetical protein